MTARDHRQPLSARPAASAAARNAAPRRGPALPALLALCALAVLLGGCQAATERIDRYGYTGDLGARSKLYVDENVRREPPRVAVQPVTPPTRELSAIFLPLRVRQNIDGSTHLGREIGRTFWRAWLAETVFPVFEFAEAATWPGGAEAAAAARAVGADLAVGGDVTYFYAGGTAGDTRIALNIEIWDAINGQMLWSIQQGGSVTRELTQDWIFTTRESRLPDDPVYAVVTALAHDMGRPVRAWQAAGQAPAAPADASANATGKPADKAAAQPAPLREQPLF
ncbi:MAG: hypothetical protein H0S85_07275 [Desulfovibrionaceae bacterium]|jgi:hypothetical protein|nr:hypothetical protein [Desulfovibrionaceae bacterium]